MNKGATLAKKSADLHVVAELLHRNIVPYLPAIDVDNVDLIIPTVEGKYTELRIVSAKASAPRKFKVNHLRPAGELFIACIEPDQTTWIIPSFAFKKYSGKVGGSFELNLDEKPSGRSTVLGNLLAPYREGWDLLTKTEEDVFDLIAMYEALAAPDEERISLADFEAILNSRV